jgi:hypothetical protein
MVDVVVDVDVEVVAGAGVKVMVLLELAPAKDAVTVTLPAVRLDIELSAWPLLSAEEVPGFILTYRAFEEKVTVAPDIGALEGGSVTVAVS